MIHEELSMKAKQAESPEALLALAKENHIAMTEESAAAYFAQMNKTGRLADDELDNVSGGGCYHDGRLIVTVGYHCDDWQCERCGESWLDDLNPMYGAGHTCSGSFSRRDCNHCRYCTYEDALWLCNHSAHRQ